MNTAVTYYSKTGHTKKVAEAIAKAAGCSAADIAGYKAAPVDVLFIGGSIYGGSLEPSLASFISGLDPKEVRSAALFTTYIKEANAVGLMKQLLGQKGIPVSAVFSCKGQFLLFNRKHPDAADLEEASKFAASVVVK